MATVTKTVVEEDLDEAEPPLADPPRVGERADLLDRDGQRSSWPDMINKATEINLNIGGLQVSFRIGVVILFVLVLCIVFIARWPTSSSPTGSQRSDAPTLDLSDLSSLNVSTAGDAKNPHTTVSLENENNTEVNSSKTPSAQAMSTFSPAIAGFSDGEVSQVLEKAIQGLRYPTDQNETIEELQALNRELILRAHQQAVEETVQTLKKKVVRLIAWVSVAVAIVDPILLVFFVIIRALLRLYWYRDVCLHGIEEDDPDLSYIRRHLRVERRREENPELDIPGLLCPVCSEPRHVSRRRRHTVRSAFGGFVSWPFLVRILSQSIYLGSAIYFLCKEQRTAGDITIIAGCGMSLLLSALSHSSAARTFWHIVATQFIRKLRCLYYNLDEFFWYRI